jgi:ABC-2 type transport system ATP-binding protein
VNEIEPRLTVVKATQTPRQTRLLVRVDGPVLDPSWEVTEVGLEDIVLAYMEQDEELANGQLVEIGHAQ